MPKLPSRCKKYSVGKEIGGAVYVHRIYEALLPEPVKIALKYVPAEFDYTVVKFVEKDSCVSFILCPEFDSAEEPTVGDIWRIDAKGSKRFFRQQSDPFIYHHKWLFVMDDYKGFDVEKSKSRSIAWMGLDGIDKNRIGRRSYWLQEVAPKIQEHGPWLNSKEIMQILHLSACELCHLRNAGKIKFVKLGRVYYYLGPHEFLEIGSTDGT